ncbi:hypothetical protein H4P12_08235 [Paracoccus sp. 11-3]|uniref:Uncharacterized protein n=1 Tax=Paracoccus amoyensis TaxID=2760093 RepID=A0A926JCS6_9RHOB|nr:hypothetical protein [Paracoccus amoyensis]MBC9246699.1 hypothetical protein [Paracoccus amoyensis]
MTVNDKWGDNHVGDPVDRAASWADLLPAVMVLIAGLIGIVLVTLLTASVPGQYLVIARPGLDQADVLDLVYRANGGVLGFGGLSNIAIVASDDPGFKQTVIAGGALFVLPSPRLLGCFSPVEGLSHEF